MNRRETIVTIIDTVEINPEIIKIMHGRAHTTEELKAIIRNILTNSNNEKRARVLHHNFAFGAVEFQNK